jgi:hypothetical protein
MSVKLVNLTGSGSLLENGIADYGYSEEVTPLEPSSSSGGISQVTVTGLTTDDTSLVVNNTMRIDDSNYGSVEFQVKNVSISDNMATITGATVMNRLNVNKVAAPHGGGGASLLTAILYYCSLADVTPIILDEEFGNELDAIDVNFLGWNGNVWEHLKKLCSAVSVDPADNVGIEMYIDGEDLVLRRAKATPISLNKISSKGLVVDSFDASKEVTVFKYETEYGVDRVIREQERQAQGLFTVNENVSITDSMQVEAGEIVTKRFAINASLSEVQQPTCVSEIFPLPYGGTTGEYVIVGSDNLPIDPEQWADQGGNVTVALTENPYEIEITVVAPPAVTMPTAANPAEATPAPYKIGVESSGEIDYPALYIVGTGVFFTKKARTFQTGADDEFTSQDTNQSVDNIFITNNNDLNTRGIAAAQAACGPSVALNYTVTDAVQFGETPGSIISAENNKFRIGSVSYAPATATITATPSSSVANFNSVWSGKTFANFTSLMSGKSIKLNEFTVVPLMGA